MSDEPARRQAEKGLRQSEERYRTIIEAIEEGYYEVDIRGNFTFVNSSQCKMLGYSREELLGMNYRQYMSGPTAKKTHEVFNEVYRTGKPNKIYEHELIKKDGNKRIVSISVSLIKDAQDQPCGFRGILRDITDLKRAEEALAKSEELQRTILSTSPVGIGLSVDRKMLWVNDAWNEMFGLGPNDADGLIINARALYPTQEEFERVGKLLYEGIEAGQANETDAIMIRKDGTIFDVHIAMKAVDPSDQSRGTIAAITDITDRIRSQEALKRSEANYRAMFDSMNDAVFVHDPETGDILDVNRKMCEMYGYTRDEAVRLNVETISVGQPPYSQSEALLWIRKAAEEGPQIFEWIGKDKTGRCFWVEVNLKSALIGGAGRILAVVRDIADRKKAEEERTRLTSQLSQAQKMESIGTLTGGIAHDFNNLLTIINGYTEMILMEKAEDDPIYGDLKKIRETGLKGAEMVQRLLAFSKKSQISPQPLDLNLIVENSVSLMGRTFPKMIEIETTLGKDLSMINADAVQVEQVLMNLCINAKEAMPQAGKLRIETRNMAVDEDYCRLHAGAKPGRHVLLEVSDTGVGIDKETMDRVFEPFFTTKGWDFRKGTGLGLSVTKGVVAQHGGWITCQSEPGKGTTFTVYFPIIKDSPVLQKPESWAETVPGTGEILLVDDEEYVRDLGKRILERAGYTVITAANGKEALEIYAREQSNIAVVILDFIMPQMEGKQCLEELLKINPQLKVIVSTGHSLDGRERLHVGSLARGFLNKPYEVRQMIQAVKAVLGAEGPAE